MTTKRPHFPNINIPTYIADEVFKDPVLISVFSDVDPTRTIIVLISRAELFT